MNAGKYNRREFLVALGGMGAALSVSVSGGCGGEEKPVIDVGPEGLRIGGRSVPLYSGGIDYWAYSPESWPSLLERLARLGINTVSITVPWSVHERSPGNYEFGDTDPSLDVSSFIELAGRNQFNVLLRMGPFVELPGGCGIPERLLYDQRVAALSGRDTAEIRHTPTGQYPAPSIYSTILLKQYGLWLDQLALWLGRHIHSAGGPVVGLMLESALCFFDTLTRPYSIDYHPDAISLYRTHLAGLHGTIEELNRVYGTVYPSFEFVEPPREFLAESTTNLPAYLDWVDFRHRADNHALDNIEQMLVDRGISGIPVIRRAAAITSEPVGSDQQPAASRIEVLPDKPAGHGGISRLRGIARSSAGQEGYPFQSNLAGGIRFGSVGGSHSPAELEFTLMISLMYGLRGWDSRMMVERDGWLAAPVCRDARVRSEFFNAHRRVCQFVREAYFHQYERSPGVAIGRSRAMDCLLRAATESRMIDDLPETGAAMNRLVDLGFETPVQACRLWAGQIENLMVDVGFDWNYVRAAAGASALLGYPVLIMPVGDFIYRDELDGLTGFVRGGGTLLYGPGKPRLDERMTPNTRIMNLFDGVLEQAGQGEDVDSTAAGVSQPGQVIRLESPLDIGDRLKELEVPLPFSRTNSRVELSVHYHGSGRMMLFAANSTDRPQRTDIFFLGRYNFRDMWDHSTFSGEGKIRIEIQPRRVMVWEVEG